MVTTTTTRDSNLLHETRDDEQDYADEGDEDNEDDSCAQVESSRTFEEQACAGDRCRITSSLLQRPSSETGRPDSPANLLLVGGHPIRATSSNPHHQEQQTRARGKCS